MKIKFIEKFPNFCWRKILKVMNRKNKNYDIIDFNKYYIFDFNNPRKMIKF